MVFPVPLPPDISEQAAAIWHEVAESLTIGDIEKLHDAIKDFISLSPKDKKTLEDMASILPYPGIAPMLITEIFTNPEATVGVIERLSSDLGGESLITKLGTAEQAIVLDALIAWLKSEQSLASAAKADAVKSDEVKKEAGKTDETKSEAKAEAATNPVNAALQSYIAMGGNLNMPLSMGSLQFLKNNAISLAGLRIADPSLLNQAYEVASGQLLLKLLPEINTSNLTADRTQIAEAEKTRGEKTTEQSRSQTIQERLVDEIRKALQDSAIPLNMQTYLVLWTAITLPQIQSPQQATENKTSSKITDTPAHAPQYIGLDTTVKEIAKNDPVPTKDTSVNQAIPPITTTPINISTTSNIPGTTGLQGIISATGILPASPIVASVLAGIPSLFADQTQPAPANLTDELGMLSYIYSQMAPYWSGPAAVSLMAATRGGETTDQKKLECSVRAFAISLGALLNDPSFDRLLATLIKRGAPTVSEEQLKVFIAAMKISILTNALVALYIVLLRKTQGQFRADELAQLILGPPLDDRIDLDDLQKGIIKSIQTELRFIPPEKREAFVNNLLSTYSQNTDINELVDPTRQFLNLCDQTLNLGKAANTKG